jgi:hypothetical protein
VSASPAADPPLAPLRIRIEVINESRSGLGGVDPAMLFQPFQQGSDPAAVRAAGPGLGLAICRLLARLMGGDATLADVSKWDPDWDEGAVVLDRTVGVGAAEVAGGEPASGADSMRGSSKHSPAAGAAGSVYGGAADTASATSYDALMAAQQPRPWRTAGDAPAAGVLGSLRRTLRPGAATPPSSTGSTAGRPDGSRRVTPTAAAGATAASVAVPLVCTVFSAELVLGMPTPNMLLAVGEADPLPQGHTGGNALADAGRGSGRQAPPLGQAQAEAAAQAAVHSAS